MKVTVEGSFDQITDVINPRPPKLRRAPNGSGYVAEQMRHKAEQYSILRQAFELVRYASENRELKETILAALIGRAERTKSVMNIACEIIAKHS
jgi:hypothetical protein